MICLSKSCLDSSLSSDNDYLFIKDYKLVRADQPRNLKRGSKYVYVKESLPAKYLPNPYLKECLTFKVFVNNKRDDVVSVYQSPSQAFDDFNLFTTNLEKKLVVNISSSNPHFILMNGDFNPRSSNWSPNYTKTADSAQLDY